MSSYMKMDMDMPMPMPPPGSMSNQTMNMKDMVMMHMSFYWGKDATILFKGWPTYSLGMYILSLFFVFWLSLSTEVLSVAPKLHAGTSPVFVVLLQAAIYAVKTALAYMVMLSVMSFNIGIFLVAVAGHTVGFFIFNWRAASRQAEQATASETAAKV